MNVFLVPSIAQVMRFFNNQQSCSFRISTEEVVTSGYVAHQLRFRTVRFSSILKFDVKVVFVKGIQSSEKIFKN